MTSKKFAKHVVSIIKIEHPLSDKAMLKNLKSTIKDELNVLLIKPNSFTYREISYLANRFYKENKANVPFKVWFSCIEKNWRKNLN